MNREQHMRRALSRLGAVFPLVVLLVLDATLLLVGSWLLLSIAKSSSPFSNGINFSFLGGQFFFSAADSVWKNTLFMGLIFCILSQQAMFVTWAVFAQGTWYCRLAVALTAAVLLDALLQFRLSAAIGDWKDAVGPFLLIPLVFLSLAAPLSAFAIRSGRRLYRDTSVRPPTRAKRHFSIANILALTAVVAVSLALARLREDSGYEARLALFMLVYSAIYVLPLVWCALVVRRSWLSLGTALSIAAVFSIPFVVAGIKDGDWPIQVGGAVGLVWTVPASLLLWRLCGYRLLILATATQPPGAARAAASRSDSGPESGE